MRTTEDAGDDRREESVASMESRRRAARARPRMTSAIVGVL